MKSAPKTHSHHASIQDIIINEDRKKLRKGEVNQLFISPNLSEIDTSEFNRHPFMFKNELFTFFVHELEKWNKKIRNKEITPFYQSELKKYNFIHSSLKIISLKKPNEINQYLEELSIWYSKNSYNIPQPSVLMKKYDLSEEWEVRKTFKSNTPSEINNYRRRFFCSPDDKDACLKTLGIPIKKEDCFLNDSMNYKLKHSVSNGFMNKISDEKFRNSEALEPFKEINENNDKMLLKKQNIEMRKNREENEIKEAENEWKSSHSRFGEKSCKNFYKGNFKTNKYFSQSTTRIEPRKIFTASYNTRNSEQTELMNTIKKRRLQTSLGFRTSFNSQQQNQTTIDEKSNENINGELKEVPKETVQNWIDNFLTDEDKLNIKNTFDHSGTGMRLMTNPFETAKTKIKRKKKETSKK